MAAKKPDNKPKLEGIHKVIVVESKSTFDKLVGEAGNKHVLVEFYAQWCGPCRIIGPRLEELAKEYADKLIILKIDVDDHEELAQEYDITSMPTFLIIKNNVTLEQFVGSSSEKVETTLHKHVGKPEDVGKPPAPTASSAAGAGTSRAVAESAPLAQSDKKLRNAADKLIKDKK